MGNTSSDVNDSLKAQADSDNGVEMFVILNFGSKGALDILMKEANKTKNYEPVDIFQLFFENSKSLFLNLEYILWRAMPF